MERTVKSVTSFAYAKRAPLSPAVHSRRFAARLRHARFVASEKPMARRIFNCVISVWLSGLAFPVFAQMPGQFDVPESIWPAALEWHSLADLRRTATTRFGDISNPHRPPSLAWPRRRPFWARPAPDPGSPAHSSINFGLLLRQRSCANWQRGSNARPGGIWLSIGGLPGILTSFFGTS